jgi:DNA-binding CsgD family transcriptional regulator
MGSNDLTLRERQVFDLVRVGLTNEEIAARLGISLHGAKYHVSQILSKLGVSSREDAAKLNPSPRRRTNWVAVPVLLVVLLGVGLAVLAVGALKSGTGDADYHPVAPQTEIRQGSIHALYDVYIGRELRRSVPLEIDQESPASLHDFFQAAGGILTDDALRIPGDSQTYQNGDLVPGESAAGLVMIIRVSGPCNSSPDHRVVQIISASGPPRDGGCLRIAFSVPDDVYFHIDELVGAPLKRRPEYRLQLQTPPYVLPSTSAESSP